MKKLYFFSSLLSYSILTLPSAYADTIQSSNGITYRVIYNKHGAVLKYRNKHIYLGLKCDVYSKTYGQGAWGWANGGTIIKFPNHKIGFPRQTTNLSQLGRCPLNLLHKLYE